MKNLEFKAFGDWSLQGTSKKEIYISLVAKIDDWKKNIVFRKSAVGEKAFNFLIQRIIGEAKGFTDWEFSITTQGEYMNSIYASKAWTIKDQDRELVFTEENA